MCVVVGVGRRLAQTDRLMDTSAAGLAVSIADR
jgi:hypothetical protein